MKSNKKGFLAEPYAEELKRANEAWDIPVEGVPFEKPPSLLGRIPFWIKGIVRRLVRPFTDPILNRQREFNGLAVTVINAMNRREEDALLEFRNTLYAGLESLRREMRANPRAPSETDRIAEGVYLRFADRHRGEPEALRRFHGRFAGHFEGAGPVLDVGCGRGEFLELLKERGVEARGIDSNRFMVDTCREKGLDAEAADLFQHMESLEDGSLGGIFASQVIEHLYPRELVAFLMLSRRKLRDGAPLVLVTPNPINLSVAASSFWIDPTHARPVHPELLLFLLEEVGFREPKTDFLNPLPGDLLLEEVEGEGAVAAAGRNFEKISKMLYAPLDYSVVCWKTSP